MILQTNFILGKMNKSVDERLVPIGEYVDALNVRLGSTESTEIGAVENSRGNTELTQLQYLNQDLSPDGTRCIGAYEDGMKETIYWFVHDASNPASASGQVSLIVSYNVNVGTLTYHVVSETVLNFSHEYLVTGVDKIGNLLFFTDDLNPPRYINVRRQYPVDTILVDPLEEEDISVILKPPGFEDINPIISLGQPFVELFSNGTTEDYMEDRFLCFAYRYRYDDGGFSATSLFTTPAFEPKEFEFSFSTFQNEGMQNKYNSARVWFSTGSRRVVEIQVLYKESSNNNIYVIDRLYKDTQGIPDNSYSYLTFTNSKILTLLGSDELLRLYDNVPRLSQAQTIQGNRLMYGNYLDQYNVFSSPDGGPIDIRFQTQPVTNPLGATAFDFPESESGVYDIDPANPGTAIDNSVLTFDLTTTTLPIAQGTFFYFNCAVENTVSTNNGGPDVVGQFIPSFNIAMTFVADQEYLTVDAMTSSAAFQNSVGTSALITPLLPYTNPTPPLYPPAAPFPPQSGTTLTDTFNSTVPFAYGVTGSATSLLLINSSIGLTCPSVPLAVFPPLTDVCGASQEPVLLQHFGDAGVATNTFTLQLPAALYYFDNGAGGITQQFQYFAFDASNSTSGTRFVAFTGSLHSQRDYEVGLVYMDEYARASTVLVNETNTVFFPASCSVSQNKIHVVLEHLPPYWAKHYKFVVKPSQGLYETVWTTLALEQTGCPADTECGPTPFLSEPGTFWFRLEGQSQNIVKVGDELTVKSDASGPVSAFVVAEVLDKSALYSGQINGTNPAGLYIRLKADGWVTESPLQIDNINCYEIRSMWDDVQGNVLALGDLIDYYDAQFFPKCPIVTESSPTENAPLTAGSFIRIKVENIRSAGLDTFAGCNNVAITYDSGFFGCTENYDNIFLALVGLDFASMVNITNSQVVDEMEIYFDDTQVYFGNNYPPIWQFTSVIFVQQDPATNIQSVCMISNIPFCTMTGYNPPGLGGKWPVAELRVQISFSAGIFCFETEPALADPNLFYDASDLLDIDSKTLLHDAKRVWDPASQTFTLAEGSVDQTATIPLQTTLDFYNCYTFGNGVESFRIEDRIDGKPFLLGERVLAVSNQDFKEADRESGMTYSGVYSDSANSNNLNEFNLGLVNYKDLETDFGPIMKMHSRETDILILQEDRISYVLAGKNVITDSTGGGAIASVPEVLGTQIARIEEYGISFNPESFASWGSAMFFTDTKRGAVLMLQGSSRKNDQLKVISSLGMRSWFRDQFNDQITTQKLGGYDPYMDEYVLTTNDKQIPLDPERFPCGQEMEQVGALEAQTFIVEFGAVIGTVNIPYTITAGQVTISVEWNGTTYTSGAQEESGSFSFDKTEAGPSFGTVTITPTTDIGVGATYGVTFECPERLDITVIQVVVNSNNYAGQSIHTQYTWSDAVDTSMVIQNAITLDSTLPTSSYISQTGIRSTGGFPYNGASVRLGTQKIVPDTFNFDPAIHRFKILSSTVLYEDNTADINALLVASSQVVPVINPFPPVFTSQEVGTIQGGTFAIPDANQYLYLVWDFRVVRCSDLCYSAVSALDACCDCELRCGSCYFSKVTQSVPAACVTDTGGAGGSYWTFNSSGSIPVVGDSVFHDELGTCRPIPGAVQIPTGYYVVDPFEPSAANPKNWVRIGAGGIVTESGTC